MDELSPEAREFRKHLIRWVNEYARTYNAALGTFTRVAGYGHAPAVLAAQIDRPKYIRQLRAAAKPLSHGEQILCRNEAADLFHAKSEDRSLPDAQRKDPAHVEELLNLAISLVQIPHRTRLPPIKTLMGGKIYEVPSVIFREVAGMDAYDWYLQNGMEFEWPDPKTGEVLDLRAHPIINGHSGFIDPYTYCG